MAHRFATQAWLSIVFRRYAINHGARGTSEAGIPTSSQTVILLSYSG